MIEATTFLFIAGVMMVVPNKFCQDPQEQHFGHHRSLHARAEDHSLYF